MRFCIRCICLVLAPAAVLVAGCAGGEQCQRGKDLLVTGDYDEAVLAFREASAQDPQNRDYRISLAEAQALAAEKHVEQAEKHLGDNRASDARKELRIALDYMPAHPKAILMIKTAEKQIQQCEDLLKSANEALARADWPSALQQANEASRFDASHAELEPLRQKARTLLVSQHLARAQAALEASDWELCQAECAKAKQVDASSEAVKKLEKEIADRRQASALPVASAKPAENKKPPVAVAAVPDTAKVTPIQPAREPVETVASRPSIEPKKTVPVETIEPKKTSPVETAPKVVKTEPPKPAPVQASNEPKKTALVVVAPEPKTTAAPETSVKVSKTEPAKPAPGIGPTVTVAQPEPSPQLAGDRLIAQADADIKAGRFAVGISALEQAAAMPHESKDLAERHRQALSGWSQSLLTDCARRAEAGDWPSAWVLAVQASAVDPTTEQRAGQACLQGEQAIREKIAYNLSVLPLKSATVGTDEALQVCQTLVTELGRIKPKHLHLLERANLAQVLAEHDLSLSSITDPAKLGVLGRKLDGTDVFLFVEVDARESTDQRTQQQASAKYVAGRKWVPNPDYATAEAELEEAQAKLAKVRARLLLNQVLSDAAAHRGQSPDVAFLRDALGGYHGLQAQQAAEAYNAALSKRDATPQRVQVDDWREHTYPVYQIERQVTVSVRLRLVEVATARILWSDNQIQAQAVDADTRIEPDAARGVAAKAAALKEPAELRAEAIAQLPPMLQAKTWDLLASRAAVYRQYAQKETPQQALDDYVRFLFDCPTNAEASSVDSVLEAVFGSRVSGDRLAECKRIVLARLELQPREAPAPAVLAGATPPAPTAGTAAMPPPAGTGVSPLPPSKAPTNSPTGTTGQQWVFFPPPSAPPAKTGTAAPPPPVQAQPPTPEAPAKPIEVFRGIVSRDDDRYPKERMTKDGIIVKVKDTDKDPLDADLEIRVGQSTKGYDDQRVGSRIRVRAASGHVYHVVILKIEDDKETVHFALEQMPPIE